MKFKDNETKNYKSNRALYINGTMEFQVINLDFQYGDVLDGKRYAVASIHEESELLELYGEMLVDFSPFVYLTAAQGEVILENKRDEDRHGRKVVNCHENDYYNDGNEKMYRCSSIEASYYAYDPESILVERVERQEFKQWKKEALLKVSEAEKLLSVKQKERLKKHIIMGRTLRDIAEEEGVDVRAIYQSIEGAIKKIRKNI